MITNQKKWDSYVLKNKDPYGKCRHCEKGNENS